MRSASVLPMTAIRSPFFSVSRGSAPEAWPAATASIARETVAIHDLVRRNIGESFNGGWHDGARVDPRAHESIPSAQP